MVVSQHSSDGTLRVHNADGKPVTQSLDWLRVHDAVATNTYFGAKCAADGGCGTRSTTASSSATFQADAPYNGVHNTCQIGQLISTDTSSHTNAEDDLDLSGPVAYSSSKSTPAYVDVKKLGESVGAEDQDQRRREAERRAAQMLADVEAERSAGATRASQTPAAQPITPTVQKLVSNQEQVHTVAHEQLRGLLCLHVLPLELHTRVWQTTSLKTFQWWQLRKELLAFLDQSYHYLIPEMDSQADRRCNCIHVVQNGPKYQEYKASGRSVPKHPDPFNNALSKRKFEKLMGDWRKNFRP